MLTSEQIGFFHAFPGFKAKHASDPSTEFVRLASMRNWEIGGETYIQYCQAFFKLDNKDSGPSSEDGGAVMTPSAFSGDSSHYDDHDRHDDAADQIEKAFQHLQLNTTIQEPVNKLKATTSITSCADGAGVKIRYFDTFQGFTHDKRAPIREEFARLAVQQKWTDRNGGMLKSEMYHRQMLRCYQEELFFHSRGYLPYLEVLQGLCRDLRSEETPVSITACKKVIDGYHVNIFDFIDCKRAGIPIPRMASRIQLMKALKKDKSFFPKQAAKGNKVTQALLKYVH